MNLYKLPEFELPKIGGLYRMSFGSLPSAGAVFDTDWLTTYTSMEDKVEIRTGDVAMFLYRAYDNFVLLFEDKIVYWHVDPAAFSYYWTAI